MPQEVSIANFARKTHSANFVGTDAKYCRRDPVFYDQVEHPKPMSRKGGVQGSRTLRDPVELALYMAGKIAEQSFVPHRRASESMVLSPSRPQQMYSTERC